MCVFPTSVYTCAHAYTHTHRERENLTLTKFMENEYHTLLKKKLCFDLKWVAFHNVGEINLGEFCSSIMIIPFDQICKKNTFTVLMKMRRDLESMRTFSDQKQTPP